MTRTPVLPLLLLTGAIWGLTPAIAKVGMGLGISAMGFAFWTAVGSALALTLLCWSRGLTIPRDRAHLVYYLAAGGSGFAMANLAGFHALQHIPAGFFALLIPLAPMLTVLGAALLGQERLTLRRVGGTALGFAGVALAMAPGAALPEASLIGWALLGALSPVCYAVSNLVAVQLAPRGTGPLQVAAGTLYAAAFFLALFGLVLGQFHLPLSGDWRAEGLLPLQAVLTAIAYLSFFRIIAAAGAVVTSQVGYIVTIAGVVWGAIFFGERMGWLALPAVALIFAGLWLVTRPGNKPHPRR
ncbi:MAG TPA: DMT family transporter [Roseococcus sp.]|jgi:drug/metabolite transporter (DMT)-like permease|nr:DMT family transporter [Roseococcus sp.]